MRTFILVFALALVQQTYATSLLVGDGTIRRFDGQTGAFVERTGSGMGVTLDPSGNIYTSYGQVLRKYSPDGTLLQTVSAAQLSLGWGIEYGPDGNLYVSDRIEDGVFRFTPSLDFIDAFVPTNTLIDDAVGLEFGPDGNLYVASENSQQIVRFDGDTGALIDVFFSLGAQVGGLGFAQDGSLLVSNRSNNAVAQLDPNGSFIGNFVSPNSGGLDEPADLSFGPDGNLYVADLVESDSDVGGRVMRYDGTTGDFIDIFATGDNMNQSFFLTFQRDVVAPEPTTTALLALGLFGVGAAARRRQVN